MKIEIYDGCYGKTITVDGQDFNDMSKDQQKEVIIEIIKNNDLDLNPTLDAIVSFCDNVIHSEADEPCEQCGHWWDEYILEF